MLLKDNNTQIKIFHEKYDLKRFPHMLYSSMRWTNICLDNVIALGKPVQPTPCDYTMDIKWSDDYYSFLAAAQREIKLMHVLVDKYIDAKKR